KDDRVAAEYLARVGRLDPALLKPITHRGEAAQADLAVLSSRDVLVRARTLLINHTRGVVKALGGRLPRCSAEAFARRVGPHVPPAVRPALAPVLEQLQQLTTTIRAFDRAVEHRCAQSYPETARLRRAAARGTDCRARRQECEEAGRDRRGPEAGGAAAPSLDQWRGVRAAAPPPGAGAGELRK